MPAPYLLHSCSAYRLDQSFFRWNFQHVVKLEAGRDSEGEESPGKGKRKLSVKESPVKVVCVDLELL